MYRGQPDCCSRCVCESEGTMFLKKKSMLAALLIVVLLSFGTSATVEEIQTLTVQNVPVKGKILLDKTGEKLTEDGKQEIGYLKDAVFEIRAAEDIVGKDGTNWYRKGDLAGTITTGGNGIEGSDLLPLGKYEVTEVKAPSGYVLDHTVYTVELHASGHEQPVVTATVSSVNDPMRLMFVKTNTAGEPMSGITFCLVNADSGKIVQSSVSDKNGVFTFTRFGYGTWKVRELDTPAGYCPMAEYTFTVDENWTGDKPVLCVNIPNHYEFRKTDSSGTPMKGVQFVLEDADGKTLTELTSDEDGMVSVRDLIPGTYFIRETKTLEGFTVSGETRKLVIDETYMIPEKLPTWVNYTNIQTGVNIAVTWVMGVGIGIMIISGTIGLIRRKKQHG